MGSVIGRSARLAGSVFVLTVVLSVAAAQAALTSYVDDFSGTMRGWAPSGSYKLSQRDGVLVMDVTKETKWVGQYLDLGGEYDFSAHPYANIRAMTDTPCLLHVYLVSGDKNDILARRIQAVSSYVELSYDFTGAKNVDLTKVKGMIFAVNGAANSWSGKITLKDLRVGEAAQKLASIEGVHDQADYRDTGRHAFLLTGVDGAASFNVTGGDKLIRNASAGTVKDGLAELSYEVIPGATGKADVTVTAVGAQGYADNAVRFPLTIEDNRPPTIDKPADLVTQVGKAREVRLTGISDGNIAVEQPLTFSVDSSNAAVLTTADAHVTHAAGSPYATLAFQPKAAGTTTLTLSVKDDGPGDNTTTTAFQVHAVSTWNNPPTIGPVSDQTLFIGAPEQRVQIAGVTDCDAGKQPLKLSATSTDTSLVTASVEYGGGATAWLRLVPAGTKTGTATITVVAQDGGGTPDNNGDQSVQVAFTATVRVRPLAGWHDTFSDWAKEGARWRLENGLEVSHVTDEGQDAVKVECKDKLTFSGLWLSVPDLDLSKAPCLTIDAKLQEDLQLTVYFFDGTGHRNLSGNQVKKLTAGQWQTVTFDFSGDGQMLDKDRKPIDAGWVTGVLLNFHPKLNWPFTRYSGTVLFRNVRIGADADVPKRQPVCSLADVADQVYLKSAGPQKVMLSGIGSGSDAAPSVTAALAGEGIVSGLSAGKPGSDGSDSITYDVGTQTGRATVSITVSAEGSQPKTVSFDVEVLDPAQNADVSIDCTQQHQRISGFGGWESDLPVDLYAKEFGASSFRLGLLENQVEPVNDNSDPNVLYEGALNRKVFDWDRLRKLQAAGVETFFVTSFTPPAWMKTNMSTNYPGGSAEHDVNKATNRLDLYQYDEFAESMVALARMFQEEGVKLTAIGFQNEPAFDEPYASAILDPKHFVDLIKLVGRRFQQEGIHVRLFMPEELFVQQKPSWDAYIDALNSDAEAQKYCDIVATHEYYSGKITSAPVWQAMLKRVQSGAGTKEVWVSETGTSSKDWASVLDSAVFLHRGLEAGDVSLWATLGGELMQRGKPSAGLYMWSQFSRHIRPGAMRVSSTSSAPDVLASCYVNDAAHGGTLASVLINTADTARAVKLAVTGRPAPARISVTRTDRVNRHADAGTPTAGGLILLPARSITTVVAE